MIFLLYLQKLNFNSTLDCVLKRSRTVQWQCDKLERKGNAKGKDPTSTVSLLSCDFHILTPYPLITFHDTLIHHLSADCSNELLYGLLKLFE